MKSTVSSISTKGQIVIPAALREELGLAPGTRISLERKGATIILRPITRAFVRSLRGSLRGSSLEELREREHRDDKR
ncbi:MAG: AbrB/MazE/SpoVT family DNA-binding domain-containing protein [Candidatus Korobacteraceae bacterium]|jgi:AbrB family looped-hinge helix DNA binding protein